MDGLPLIQRLLSNNSRSFEERGRAGCDRQGYCSAADASCDGHHVCSDSRSVCRRDGSVLWCASHGPGAGGTACDLGLDPAVNPSASARRGGGRQSRSPATRVTEDQTRGKRVKPTPMGSSGSSDFPTPTLNRAGIVSPCRDDQWLRGLPLGASLEGASFSKSRQRGGVRKMRHAPPPTSTYAVGP